MMNVQHRTSDIPIRLVKLREEKNSELLYALRQRKAPAERPRCLVVFRVEKEFPLVGPGKGPEGPE